jgi:hypothetical protein
MSILFVVAFTLLVLIGPALVLLAACVRHRQAAARRRGFDVHPPDDREP